MADGKGRGKIHRAKKPNSDWVTKLQKNYEESTPPEGYKSIPELVKELGVAKNTLHYRVKAMVASGELAEIECRHKLDGVLRKIKYYGPPNTQ